MQTNIDQINKLKLYFKISLGIFLFILFFHPFEINFDINNQLIFIAGLSAITFLSLVIVNLILPLILPGTFDFEEWEYNPDLLIYSLILVISSAAFVFYLRYVGKIPISFFLVFKIALISLAPLVILKINGEYHILMQRIHSLSEENKKISTFSSDQASEENILETFLSDNKSDKIDILLNDILLINSADNYVKIIYLENNKVCNKLIRITLKNVDEQLKKYPAFIRCHRSCIVNIVHVNNLNSSYKGYRLTINNYEEEIPVSLQYILKVRESLGDI